MICILGSTENDFIWLLRKAKILCKQKFGLGCIYWTYFCGLDVLFVSTGYNKVNIGLVGGYILSHYKVSCFIGLGNCGYIGDCNVAFGDIAIVTNSLQYDVNSSPIGYPKTVIPGLEVGLFTCDDRLVNLVKKACNQLCYQSSLGRAATGETFIANNKQREYIAKEFASDFVDMECGASGEIAYIYHIPSVFIKGISNYATDCASEEYEKYNNYANQRANEVVQVFMEYL